MVSHTVWVYSTLVQKAHDCVHEPLPLIVLLGRLDWKIMWLFQVKLHLIWWICFLFCTSLAPSNGWFNITSLFVLHENLQFKSAGWCAGHIFHINLPEQIKNFLSFPPLQISSSLLLCCWPLLSQEPSVLSCIVIRLWIRNKAKGKAVQQIIL